MKTKRIPENLYGLNLQLYVSKDMLAALERIAEHRKWEGTPALLLRTLVWEEDLRVRGAS